LGGSPPGKRTHFGPDTSKQEQIDNTILYLLKSLLSATSPLSTDREFRSAFRSY
jgi:hypothetical protein